MRANIELIYGDGVKALLAMEDNRHGLAICDPPYFEGPEKLGYYGKGYSSSIGVYREEYEKIGVWSVPRQSYFYELSRISKNQIIWGINHYDIKNPGPGRIIWDKVNGDSSFSDCEIAYNSCKDRTDKVVYMWNGMMQGLSIDKGHIQQGNKKLNEKRIHPTQKPVALYKWILQNYAKEGDSIVDTHGGSMSLAIACWDLKFDLTVYELDKKIYDKGVKRFENHCKQGQLF